MKREEIAQNKFNRKIALLISAVVAVSVFLLIYGPYTLDVTNISWIFYEFDGTDIIQHQAGWEEYRTSDWTFPLGYAADLAYGDGIYITYTDSIPYLAIFFKMFRNVIPTTFQYFGWFSLLCFILQGIAACLLLMRKSNSYIPVLVGEVFFLTCPVFIERVFKHTALGAQWLILFSIYYYLEYRGKPKETNLPWQMILLSVLTIGIHPYFIPMVMIFVLLIMIEALIKRVRFYRVALFGGLSVGLTLLAGYLIGAIGNDVKANRGGYGEFGMNLNALFNPRSYGFVWSKILPIREWILNNYEGFNYLGIGMLFLFGWCLVSLIYHLICTHGYAGRLLKFIRKNLILLCGMTFMAAFAITFNVAFDGRLLFHIQLPDYWKEKCDIFRASGRMFFPCYYLIMLSTMYYVINNSKWFFKDVVFAGMLFLQIWDMGDVLQTKHESIKNNYYRECLIDDENLSQIRDKDVLVIIGTKDFNLQRRLAIWAGENNIAISYPIANTGVYSNAYNFTYAKENEMASGFIQENVVYVTQDEDVMQLWRETLEGQDYMEYKRGYYYFVYTP
jgi:hypothetical protein